MQVRNPRNGEYDYVLEVDSTEDIQRKATSLREQQSDWQSSGIEYRANVLMQLATLLEKSQTEIIEQLSIDTGRQKISNIELMGTVGMIKGRCYSSPKLMAEGPVRQSASNPTVNIKQQLVPYELVGVISPWNFPLLLALIDTVPALLAGCTVLLKPSEVTPRFIDPLEKMIRSIPKLDTVIKFVRGGAEAGKVIVDNVDAICFTGSVTTGKKIASRAAENFIPAFLELGGKDPAIVLEDADLEKTADAVLRSAAGATGQACQALERIYVHDNILSEFIRILSQKIDTVSFNDDNTSGGTMGPIIFEKQAEKIKSQLKEAIDQGASILTGGEIHEIHGGLWMKPTIVTQVDHGMTVMSEETFGPVIPIMSFSTEEEAIALANDSQFGLSASVFSIDSERAIRVAEQLHAGGISINDASLTNQVFDATKNSFKMSGMNGSRMGIDGFTRFFRKKALLIQTAAPQQIFSQEEEHNDF